MHYQQLGSSELRVSELCLGTMTWGEQNSVEDAHSQLDYAVAQGINFIDAAEMYPVPARCIRAFRIRHPRRRYCNSLCT